MSDIRKRLQETAEIVKNRVDYGIKKFGDFTKIKHGCLDITYRRYPTQYAEIEIFYKDNIPLARKPNLIEALEYAYIGVTLSNPALGDWCWGDEQSGVLSHITDMLKMLGVEIPRPDADSRLITGIYRSIPLRTEDGYLHPKEEDIKVVIHRCIPPNYGCIATTISLTDFHTSISQKFNEHTRRKLSDLDDLARKLYAKHFE